MENQKPNGETSKDFFDVIHGYGPWQRNTFIILFFINCIGMWHNFAITFIAPKVDFHCVPPNNLSQFEGFSANQNVSVKILNQCDIVVAENDSSEIYNTSFSSEITIPCTQWDYNLTFQSNTIVSQWNLVCDREWLISLSKSIYMFGFMVSVLIFGQISDCVGRWPTIMVCFVITCVSGIMSAFSSSYIMFAILRFFQAFGRTGLTTTGFVLIMEIIGPQYRTIVGIGIQVGWSVGFMTLPLVAWFVRDWFWLQLAITIPITLFFFMYWTITESPRWLMTKGKITELQKTIRKAAKTNRQYEISNAEDLSSVLSFQKVEEKDVKQSTLLDLFRKPRMRNRALNTIYLWIVNAFVYYSLSYNTNDFGGDPYLNFFIAGVLELPSYLLVYFLIARFGRRIPLMVIMVIAGVACAAIIISPESMPVLSTTLAMIGKFCITGSFGILYLYCSELFPTVVRNVAIGSCSTCARVGSILAPFSRELGRATHPAVPNALYAFLAVSSGLLALLLPETKGKKIPDTLEEGEQFGLKLESDTEFSLKTKKEDGIFLILSDKKKSNEN